MSLVKTMVMESMIGQISIKPSSRKDPCGICGRKTMANAVSCKSCGNWVHVRCVKIERVTKRLAIDFKCRKCKGCHKNVEDQKDKWLDVKTVTDISYLVDGINSGGGCDVAVTSRTRLGCVRFRYCQDYIAENFSLKINGIVYKSCVR